MLASELLAQLQNMIIDHGDLPVLNDRDESVTVEYNTDGEPAFVVS